MSKINSLQKPRIIVVSGPTASGKSDLAIALAQQFNGEIISADSRQVYKGMDIGTGKVTKKEQKLAHHWLLDIASPKRQYSVAQWKLAAQKAIRTIVCHGKTPIICGGTGFWIDALVYDATLPNVKPNPALRATLQKYSTTELYARLQKLDPARAAAIDRHNPHRLIRAIEIVTTTKQPVPTLTHRSPFSILYLALVPEKELLKARITKRLDARLKQGMVAEVQKLNASGVSWKRLESFGLEYKWLAYFLQKKITRNAMREGLLRDIIKYSKRQMTWLHRNKDITWLTGPAEAKKKTAQFLGGTH